MPGQDQGHQALHQLAWRLRDIGGLAIYDTMQHVACDVSTICVGMAASMGAVLLAGGTKGKRFALPNSEIMIHQVLGGAEGQATDIKIRAERILKTQGPAQQDPGQAHGPDVQKSRPGH